MKKIYFLAIATIALFVNANAQENVVTGSDMEDASSWNVTQISTDYLATVTFGYTDDGPSAGSDGALRVECTNEANGTTNVIIWQEVDLVAGHRYVVDAAFKGAITVSSFWAQWVVESSSTLPEEGTDYSSESNARAQINSWNGNVTDWDLDITLQIWEYENGQQSDTVVVDEDGTYVYGVKIGIWYASQLSYDVLIDNMTLTDLDATSGINDNALASFKVFPNPTESNISIVSNKAYDSVRILNISGQKKFETSNINSSINIGELESGVYFVELMNNNKAVAISRLIKQ